jgi:elongation factor P--beta-lysine ligase
MLSEFQKHNKVLDLFEKKPILTQRSRLFYFIREYFYKNEFIEVDTPIVCGSLAPEVGIDAPKLEGRSEFLRTSPELDMKQMLVAGFERIFLLGACFREGELSATHREEFTMLEWYQVNSDYIDLIRFTAGMLRHISLGLINVTGIWGVQD